MAPSAVSASIDEELRRFHDDCVNRYRFNSRWDNTLNLSGILLGAGIVTAGVYQQGTPAAIMGAFVSAIVSAQRSFPFGMRASFYRALVGRADNLITQFQQGLIDIPTAVATLNSLRLDFAQQFPRGGTFKAPNDQIAN